MALRPGMQKNGSFRIDQAEGGTALVSAELRDRLAAHGADDGETLQALWGHNIWSVADLQGIDTEVLVDVSCPAPLAPTPNDHPD